MLGWNYYIKKGTEKISVPFKNTLEARYQISNFIPCAKGSFEPKFIVFVCLRM